MTQEAEKLLQDRLYVVRTRYIDLLEERMDSLEVLRDQISQQDKIDEALHQTRFIAHKISGTAATLGFTEIGQLAANTENTIIHYQSDKRDKPTLDEAMLVIDTFLENAAELCNNAFWKSSHANHKIK